ncbi:MAG TPA: hypothetical protein VIM17_09050, partial [Jatrophihabitantaceae bacterium]
GTAADRLELATELTRLPATLDLLELGEISTHHARHLGEAIVGLTDPAATAVEATVLANADSRVGVFGPGAGLKLERRVTFRLPGRRSCGLRSRRATISRVYPAVCNREVPRVVDTTARLAQR